MVRLRATLTMEYEADPDAYEGVTDPKAMAWMDYTSLCEAGPEVIGDPMDWAVSVEVVDG